MTAIRYQRLAPERLPLANKFYKGQRSPMRVGRSEQVWVAEQEEILAACCLKPVADGYWLTALLVAREQRRQGIAAQLLGQLRRHTTGPIWLFCAPELVDFYRRLGFLPCHDLPAELTERLRRYQQKQPLLALAADAQQA